MKKKVQFVKGFFKTMTGIFVFCGVAGSPFLAHAHHALEFIDVESYSVAPHLGFIFYTRYDYRVDDKNDPSLDHWEITPGISCGLFNFLMLDAHTHLARFGPGHVVDGTELPPFFEAFSVSALAQITRPRQFFLDLAFYLSYENPFERSRNYLDGKYGIEGMLVAEHTFANHAKITVNAGYSHEFDGETDYPYAIGIKTPLTEDEHGISAGLEIFGSFKSTEIETLAGVYMPFLESILMKVGLGISFEEELGAAKGYRAAFQLMYIF